MSHIFTRVDCGHTVFFRDTIWSSLAAGIKICSELHLRGCNQMIIWCLADFTGVGKMYSEETGIVPVRSLECRLPWRLRASLIATRCTLEVAVTHYHLSWIIPHSRRQAAAQVINLYSVLIATAIARRRRRQPSSFCGLFQYLSVVSLSELDK